MAHTFAMNRWEDEQRSLELNDPWKMYRAGRCRLPPRMLPVVGLTAMHATMMTATMITFSVTTYYMSQNVRTLLKAQLKVATEGVTYFV